MKATFVKTALLAFVLFPLSLIVFSQTNDELKMKIQKMNDELAKAMMNGDSEKNLSYYTTDAISLPNNAPMAEGIEAIKKSNQEMMNLGMKITSCNFVTLKVIPNNNLITEIGTYKMSVSTPDMQDPMEDEGKYLNIWEKQPDGSLKIKVEMWNTNSMPMIGK
jgi:ketosteroid isomerase-like protein